MGTNFDGLNIIDVRFGTIPAYRLYKGNTLVWQRLPTEYQEVEYIESTGTQYIDTGMKGTENTKVDIEFQITSTRFLPFGARRGATSDCFAIWALSTDVGSNLRIGFDGTSGYTGRPTTTDKYHIIHSLDNTYVNEVAVWKASNYNPRTFETPQNLLVFGYYSSISNRGLSGMKLYSLKLWENNIIVRDLVPCYRKADNKPGMYDLVNDVFYTNDGTGEFIIGDNI